MLDVFVCERYNSLLEVTARLLPKAPALLPNKDIFDKLVIVGPWIVVEFIVPLTSNKKDGDVVPMPTFPVCVILNLSVVVAPVQITTEALVPVVYKLTSFAFVAVDIFTPRPTP
jgi:hypothetical protein